MDHNLNELMGSTKPSVVFSELKNVGILLFAFLVVGLQAALMMYFGGDFP